VISMGKDAHEDVCCHTCELFGDAEPPPVVVETPTLEVTEPKRLKILVRGRGGAEREYVPTSTEITVGRVTGNDIVLPHGTISKRQARFVLQDGKVILVDLKSGCGTYVNGRKITSPVVLREDATVHMGDFMLRVVTE
jgi:pSer/pThr/pTyr-binding forkhead associated (FHA) protein